MPGPIMSRRLLIAGVCSAAIASVFVGASPPSRAAAASVRGMIALDQGGANLVRFFSSDWTVAHSAQAVQQFTLSATDAEEVTLRFVADARLFEPSEKLAVLANGVPYLLAPTSSTVAASTVEMQFVLPLHVISRGELQVLRPLRVKDYFPNDNVDAPIDAVVHVRARFADGAIESETVSAWAVQSREDVAPFAVDASGIWATVSSSADALSVYRAPIFVRIEAQGPFAVPAGATLTITSDARMASAPSVTARAEGTSPALAALDFQAADDVQDGRSRLTTIDLPELPAGSTLILQLAWAEKVIPKRPTGVIGASVALQSRSTPARPDRRNTQPGGGDETSLESLAPTIDVARQEVG